MIKINKSPVLTSQNYGANYFEINERILNQNFEKFNTYKISNTNGVSISELKTIPDNLISTELDSQSKSFTNFKKQIVFENDAQNNMDICFDISKPLADVIDVIAKKQANSKLVLKYLSNDNMYHNSVLNISLEENAQLDIVILCDMKNLSNNFLSLKTELDTNSQLNIYVVDFGCENTVQKIQNQLNGDNARVNLNSVYFGSGKNNLGINYTSNVYGKFNKVNMNTYGVLNHFAKKNFVGTIDFKVGSKKSAGNVSENCIMLSKNCKAISTPILLCEEEDVDGKHSSSLGRIDDEELFYMMTRGLSKQEATQLIIEAKLLSVVNNIFDEDLKEMIEKKIEEKLNEDWWYKKRFSNFWK